LCSTSGLLDLYRLDGVERGLLERKHRPESVTINRLGFPPAVIRDQKPLNISRLESCLTDMTVPEWLRHLNRRAFFWTSERRLERMLMAKPYRQLPHDVLVVETAPLVARYAKRITLAPYNTGATMPIAVPRGSDTFRSIPEYPLEYWLSKRPGWDAVVEVAVEGCIPDIERFVTRVESRLGTTTLSTIWSVEAEV
jgi:hypothetical protein